MADVQCSGFTPIEWDPKTGKITWSATLTPAPTPGWEKAFREGLATEAAIANSPGENLRIQGTRMTFAAPENAVQAAAGLVHRVVQKTNSVAAKVDADVKKTLEAEKKSLDDARAELNRLKEKYKDGI